MTIPSGEPAGPTGCAPAAVGLIIVILAMGAFIAAVWWLIRDAGIK